MTRRQQQHRRSIGERFVAWLVRSYVWGPSRRQAPPEGPVPPEPAADTGPPLAIRAVLLALAVALPILVAALLIPFRTTLTTSTQTLLLVLPVVAIAIIAHRGTTVVAAVSAALAYDVLLTRPYYSFVIDAAEDIEASLVLGLIGVLVGTFVARELEQRIRSAVAGGRARGARNRDQDRRDRRHRPTGTGDDRSDPHRARSPLLRMVPRLPRPRRPRHGTRWQLRRLARSTTATGHRRTTRQPRRRRSRPTPRPHHKRCSSLQRGTTHRPCPRRHARHRPRQPDLT